MTLSDNDSDTDFEVELTPPSYALKARAPESGVELSKMLFEADNAVAALSRDYEKWVKDDMAKLETAYEELRASGGAHEQIKAVHGISHDMLGQGGSFGYPLITLVGTSLCKILKDRETLDERLIDAAGVHVASMRLIITMPLKDDGGSDGAKLVAELEKVCASVTA